MERRSFLATVAAVALLAAPSVAKANDKAVLMLNWVVYGEHAPFIYGKELGYYADEGIDLEIQEGRGSGVTIQAVGAGTVEFGLADTAVMIKAAAKGAPVKSVGVLLQRTFASLVSPAGKIDKPEDIAGKTIAITPGDAVTPLWPLYLNKIGIKGSDVKTVAGDAQTKLNAVVNGQADGLLGSSTEQGARLPDIIKAPVSILRFTEVGITLVGLGIVASDRTMESNPDLVRRFMKASTRSVEAAMADPEAAVKVLLEKYPSIGLPEAQLRSLKYSQALYFAEGSGPKPFRADPSLIDQSLETLVTYGGMPEAERGKAEDYFTVEFLP
ncbi:MAG: ABC transporter substrate-binding protein [Rhizobiaceae bacterium]